MRTILLLLSILICQPSHVSAQQSFPSNTTLDSLLSLEAKNRSQTDQFQTFIDIAKIYSKNFDFNEAATFYLKAQQIAQKLNDGEKIIQASYGLCASNCTPERFELNIREVKKYLPQLELFSDKGLKYFMNIAIVLIGKNRSVEALEILYHVEKEFEKRPDRNNNLYLIETIKRDLFVKLKDFEGAEECMNKAFIYAQNSNNPEQIFHVKARRCGNLRINEDYNASYNCLQELLKDTMNLSIINRSVIYNGLATDAYKIGQFEASIYFGKQVIERKPSKAMLVILKMNMLKSFSKLEDEDNFNKHFKEAKEIIEEEELFMLLPELVIERGKFYQDRKQYSNAIADFSHALDSIDYNKSGYTFPDQKIITLEALATSHHLNGDHQQAYFYQNKLLEEKEIIEKSNKETAMNASKYNADLTFEKTKNEQAFLVAQNEQQKKMIWLAGFLALLFFVLGLVIWNQSKRLATEKKKSEEILFNVMPTSIAHRMKAGETSIADHFEDSTVIFIDIVGFTSMSTKTSPEEILRLLNVVFSKMDQLSEKFNLEKIKTIGDCYMAVSGIPTPSKDHLEKAIDFCLAVLNEIHGHHFSKHLVELRIGLESGPTIAGVIGEKKFLFDLWGDTVNTASRMETNGIKGAIQTTRNVYDRIKGKYPIKRRDVIDVKGKGKMEVFVLS